MTSAQPPLEHGFTAVDVQEDPHTWIRVLDTLGREPFYVAYKRRVLEMVAPDPAGRYLDVGGGAQALVALTEARADRTFQHLIEPELALAEMLRVTRSGGRVVVVDPGYDTQVVDVDDQQGSVKVRACLVGDGRVSRPGGCGAGTAPGDHVGIPAHDQTGPPCLPAHHPP